MEQFNQQPLIDIDSPFDLINEEIIDDIDYKEEEEDLDEGIEENLGDDLDDDGISHQEDDGILDIVADNFRKNGIAAFPEGWKGNADEFKEVLLESVKKDFVNSYSLNNDDILNFIEYIGNGGDPSTYINSSNGVNVDTISDEEIYIQYMKSTTNFSDAKIKKLMENSKEIDEFEDEVEEFREEIRAAQREKITQELETSRRKKEEEQAILLEIQKKKKDLVRGKEIFGVKINKNKEFEDWYFNPSETIEYEGNKYKVTGYQKSMFNKKEKQTEYEMFLAYLDFINYKMPTNYREEKNDLVSALKSKLITTNKEKRTTRLI